jgi:para-nitrobenzyl esterase
MFRRGEVEGVPLMIGTVSHDLALKFPSSLDNPLSYFGANADEARMAYNPHGWLDARHVLLAIAADLTMHEPARFVATQMTGAGKPVWLYRFDYVAESLRAKTPLATHSSDLPFLFQRLDARYGTGVTAKDREMAAALTGYFVNFVKNGNPNGGSLPAWPKFDPAQADLMTFTRDNGPVVGPDPLKQRLDLVQHAVDGARDK